MEAPKGLEYKVGIFVAVSLIMAMAFILAIGGDKALFHRNFTLKIRSEEAGGLSAGSIVQVSGITAGNVVSVMFDNFTNRIVIYLNIDRKFLGHITSNSSAVLQTQGALGDKFVLIKPGASGGEALKDGDFIELDAGTDLFSTLGKSGSKVEHMFSILENVDHMTSQMNQRNFAGNLADAIRNLKTTTQSLQEAMAHNNHMKKAVEHVASILEKIDNGQGTLGGLINDPTVHEDLKTILGGAKRSTILRYIIRQTIKSGEEEEAKERAQQK